MLAQMCVDALRRDPTRDAIEFRGEWVCWGQLAQLADRLTALLAQSGAHAAPIVFVPHNRPSAAAALLALLAQARTVRMVYAFQSPVAIARELERIEARIVVASAEVFSPEVYGVLQARGAAAIALTEVDAAAVEGLERCSQTHATGCPLSPEVEILTSGTTGPPKRIGMAHDLIAQHFVNANKNYKPTDDLAREVPMFSYYPLANISGIYGVVAPLLRGHRVVLVERFRVDLFRDYVRRHRPDRASLPPAGFQMVLDADVPPEELASVRCIATGAAPLPLDVHRKFEARYGIPILTSYGATEFGGPVTSMTLELHSEWGEKKLGSVGRPIAGSQLRVVDPQTRALLPPGEEGILEVLSPRVGLSWIYTSDLAVVDADGFLYLRGRADGAILRGGFKLLPETIERALLLHMAVSAVAVVSLPDARLGQVPAAAVEIKPGAARPSARELEQHLRGHVPSTHVPVAWHVLDELPRTASLKVDLVAVRALFAR